MPCILAGEAKMDQHHVNEDWIIFSNENAEFVKFNALYPSQVLCA
jgi:hypothetical protein